ncbi:MAG: glutamate--tRNA ligase [Candidatus Omnitrophica bacterium]|nr:glutamate--tRNA ligase [Candidatus Omnitrophota bacterium]
MIRVRFAPSPTGYLHLGNVRTALFNYLFAKSQAGRFILRVEDTDLERSKPEFRAALIEDLRWMGIQWDEGPEAGGAYGPYLQSERLAIYKGYVERLLAAGKAYACYVTEEEAEESKRLARLEKRPPRFDNRGRHFTAQEIESRKARGIKPTIRFKVEDPQVVLHDLVRGEVHFNLDDMVGDFVIVRADGSPTFHLAVCVDDGLMGVTHVIRGEDHLSNTPKHILLLKAMGFTPPQYGHLALIHGPGGEPLSKRLGDVSVREFRRKGYLPFGLANYIALLGWSPGENREILSWKELQELFSLERVNKGPSIYDPHKLDWLNGEHLRRLAPEEFAARAFDFLQQGGFLQTMEPSLVMKVLPVFQDNIERFDQLPDKIGFLSEDFGYENRGWLESDEGREVCRAALEILPEMEVAEDGLYDRFVNALKPKVRAKGKNFFMPIRMALTGREHGPEMKRLFPALGLNRAELRFKRAVSV